METAEPSVLVGILRFLFLLCCMGGAAAMDHWQRRVPNDWWIRWGVAIVFLLCIEMMMIGADLPILLMTLGIIAWASISVLGTPSLADIKAGSKLDLAVSLWYILGFIGLVSSLFLHGENALWIIGFLVDAPIFNSTNTTDFAYYYHNAHLLLDLIGLSICLGFIELAWRMRLLHGGADAKALMIVAIALPWFGHSVSSDLTIGVLGTTGVAPPMISVLVWSAVGFLLLPIFTTIRNLSNGVKSPLKMIWHAEKWELDKILGKHVWILSEVIDDTDGARKVVVRMRPRRKKEDKETISKHISELKELGETEAWITKKHPFLIYVFPAIILTMIFGDPIAYILLELGQ